MEAEASSNRKNKLCLGERGDAPRERGDAPRERGDAPREREMRQEFGPTRENTREISNLHERQKEQSKWKTRDAMMHAEDRVEEL